MKTKIQTNLPKISTWVLILLLITNLSFNLNAQSKTKKVSGKAPEFTMKSFEGEVINSEDLKGKVILLEFWDTYCSPCIKLMPDFEKLTAKYKNNDNVVIISVNAGWETMEKAKAFIEKRNFNLYFAYMEKKEARKLKVRELPCTIIIDKNFEYSYKHIGLNEETETEIINEFDEQIQLALSK